MQFKVCIIDRYIITFNTMPFPVTFYHHFSDYAFPYIMIVLSLVSSAVHMSSTKQVGYQQIILP